MARGNVDVEGWHAVASVAGMGAGMMLTAGVLWFASRVVFRDQPGQLATYRTAGAPGSNRASNARGLAILMASLCALSQLLYIGLYVELAQWLLGAREQPHLSPQLFFWVFLVNGTCVFGSLYTGLKRAPSPS